MFPELHLKLIRRYYPDSVAESLNTLEFLEKAVAAHDDVSLRLPRRPSSLADWKAALLRPSNSWGPQPWAHDSTGVSKLPDYVAWRGMPVVAGTDAAPPFKGIAGYGLHEVLVSFVLGGMTSLEALQTATLNPAVALHATDSLGTVEAGKVADLVLLDADPLQDIWNTTKIRAVVANGRYFDRAGLDQLQSQAERAARRAHRRLE